VPRRDELPKAGKPNYRREPPLTHPAPLRRADAKLAAAAVLAATLVAGVRGYSECDGRVRFQSSRSSARSTPPRHATAGARAQRCLRRPAARRRARAAGRFRAARSRRLCSLLSVPC